MIPKQLYTVSSKSPLANDPKNPLHLDNFLRLDDGHLFNLPKKFEEMSVDEREKWLNETRVNFAIDHHGDTDQWEIKLRNVKFAQLPDENWTSLSGKELQEQFPKLKWKEASNSEAELKQKGFYSLTFTAGMPPPMTFAYETTDGRCGIFQFSGSTLEGSRDTAFIRYKQIQQIMDAPSDSARPWETNRELLKIKLQQAYAEASRLEKEFDAGLIDIMTFQAAKSNVELLKAELTGDAMQMAQVSLDVARRQLDLVSKLFEAGISTASDLEKAKSEITLAEAHLREVYSGAAEKRDHSESTIQQEQSHHEAAH